LLLRACYVSEQFLIVEVEVSPMFSAGLLAVTDRTIPVKSKMILQHNLIATDPFIARRLFWAFGED
jgi:hypothetical protein